MSGEEFALRTNDGGASRRVDTAEEGPAKGYYVSTPEVAQEHGRAVTAADARAHRESLRGKRGYQGGWREGDTMIGRTGSGCCCPDTTEPSRL